MKLYIWESNGISDAYHDDGTLVVLAESPEQAREIALASNLNVDEGVDKWERGDIWRDGHKGYGPDASPNTAVDREPDRIVDLTAPCVVAFNGGGYD